MFLHPLGLLALLGVPLVLALHLFRRRHRRQPVSALFLWEEEADPPATGRRRARLRASSSLFLELLVATLLGLALAGPVGCAGGPAPHLVVVLDTSASMGARGPGGSFLAAARARIEERLDALPRGARATLVVSGPPPRVAAGPAASPVAVRAALDALVPRAPHQDLGPALRLGLELAGPGGVLLVTDHAGTEPLPDRVEELSVGAPLDNAGIVRATRVRDEDGDHVLLTVADFTRAGTGRDLVLAGPDGELLRRPLSLAPGARAELAFQVPDGVGAVHVRLAGEDALALDDEAVLEPEPPRVLALACTLPLEEARLLALADGDDPLGRLLRAVPDTRRATSPEAADLLVGHAPGAGPATWSLVLDPLGSGRRDLVGPFLADPSDPLLDGLTLEGLVWSVDPELRLPGTALVTAGDQAILTEEVGARRRVVHLDLDPARSSLARTPDWAILLANLAELRRAALPGAERSNVPVGADFVLNGAPEGTLVVRGPDGAERELPSHGTLLVPALERPGRYAVLDPATPNRVLARFAVSFQDAVESDLRGAGAGTRGVQVAGVAEDAGRTPLVAAAAALALAALLLDWWVLRAPRAAAGLAGEVP